MTNKQPPDWKQLYEENIKLKEELKQEKDVNKCLNDWCEVQQAQIAELREELKNMISEALWESHQKEIVEDVANELLYDLTIELKNKNNN